MKCSATAWPRFSSFFEKPFVRRVNRRIDIRIVRTPWHAVITFWLSRVSINFCGVTTQVSVLETDLRFDVIAGIAADVTRHLSHDLDWFHYHFGATHSEKSQRLAYVRHRERRILGAIN